LPSANAGWSSASDARNSIQKEKSTLIAAILALVVVALAGGAYAYLVYSPKPQMPSLSSKIEHATMTVGNRKRSYLAYVPARLPSGAALVIVLHGSGRDGAKMRAWTGYEFDRMAAQQGFVVLYKHNWNDCRKNATFPAKVENIDDMGFIRALIDRVTAAHAINPKRVYAFGYSNGGHMAFRLAIEAPSEVAAIRPSTRACRPRTLHPAPNWVKHPAPCWSMGPTIQSILTRVA